MSTEPVTHAELGTYVTAGEVAAMLMQFDPTLPFTILTPCGTRTPAAIDVVPADFGQMVQLS